MRRVVARDKNTTVPHTAKCQSSPNFKCPSRLLFLRKLDFSFYVIAPCTLESFRRFSSRPRPRRNNRGRRFRRACMGLSRQGWPRVSSLVPLATPRCIRGIGPARTGCRGWRPGRIGRRVSRFYSSPRSWWRSRARSRAACIR